MRKVAPPSVALHKAFCEEYLVDKCKSRAAERAGYAKKSAGVAADKLMKRDDVKMYIEYRLDQLARRSNITAERVLEEYAKIAFVNPQHFYDDSGNLLSVPDLDEDVAAVLTGIEVSTEFERDDGPKKGAKGNGAELRRTTTTKIKMSDKKAALDSIARHLGMFVDKTETKHSGEVHMTISNSDAEL